MAKRKHRFMDPFELLVGCELTRLVSSAHPFNFAKINQGKREFLFNSLSYKFQRTLLFTIVFFTFLCVSNNGWSQSQTYNSSGTFTVPAGVTSVSVQSWGGGGGGGFARTNGAAGGGGGGGGYTISTVTVIPGTDITVTVGTAGAGGTTGGLGTAATNGGNTTFNSSPTVVANGGRAGGSVSRNSSGAGGIGGTGGNYDGGNGANGVNGTGAGAGGGGGGGSAGTASNGNAASGLTGGTAVTGGGAGGNGARNAVGGNGSAPGGGGAGGNSNNNNRNGGNGAAGRVIVTYTCPTYSLTGISATNACSAAGYRTSTVTLSSSAAGLPLGDYTVTYSRTIPNATGLTATFTVSVAGTGQFTAIGFNTNGTSTITVTNLTSSYCSSAISSGNSTSITVSGSVPAQPSAITGSTTPCNGSSETYSVSNVPGVSYSWSLPSGWVQTGGGNTNLITVTVGNEIGNIVVTPSNGCGNGTSRSLTITQTGPELITSPGSQCLYGATVDVTVSANSSSTGTFRWYNSSYTLLETESSVSESSYDANGISANTTYYVTLESGGCTTPYTKVIAYAIIPPTLDASHGGSFCVDSTIYLYSGGTYDNIYWEGPDEFYSIEEDPEISSATTGMNGTYTVHTNTLSGVNLVVNGDFEDGNVGFTSEYAFRDSAALPVPNCYANAPLGCPGTYSVVRSPISVHPNFPRCGDKTTGSGFQMVINGAATANEIIWSQTVNVVENTYYQFSYWVQSVRPTNPSVLQLYINGEPAGPEYTASLSTCTWTQFFYSWDSGTNNEATLSLVNQNTGGDDNDFTLDDIIFQHTCTASASVEVNVSNSFTPLVSIAASPSNTICAGEEVTFTATPTHGGATPSYQWRLNSNNVGSNSPTYTNSSLANGDKVSCVMTSSLSSCLALGSNPATSNTVTMTVNPLPTFTPGTDPDGCIGNTTASFTYSNPLNSPDEFSIEWGALALSEDFIDVTGATLTASPLSITVPIDAPANTYPGTLYLTNTTTGCISTAIPFNVIMDICFSITAQPIDEEVCAGDNAQFSVTTDATSPTYQWQENQGSGWSDLTGEEAATLTLNAVTTGMNGYLYRCQVTEGGVTLDSDPATLTVNPLPTITPGANPSACSGAMVTYLTYSGLTGSPDRYSIDFDTDAEAEDFADVTNVSLTVSPISITVPATAAAGVYNATLTVNNSTTNCSSIEYPITVSVFYPEVDVSALVSNPKCPDLDSDLEFNANSAEYDAGASEIIFRITRVSPADQSWYFNYNLTLTGSVLDSRFTQPDPNPSAPVVISKSVDYYDLTFYIVNQPGDAVSATLNIVNVSTGGCTDVSNGEHSVQLVVSPMPEIGSFN